ncbi:hypothetical protein EDC44_1284 [Cricetibacter osteomyelitidis]|uniref:Uncharacterized protein n=1 Tax=Cricetibacter osteomyelitidis TaxID=1521931 RepID=A0A4R2STL2_9PAST|nr:hypothetical protein EDC44_1284 [Cricetibacter osteomyelitidis]
MLEKDPISGDYIYQQINLQKSIEKIKEIKMLRQKSTYSV